MAQFQCPNCKTPIEVNPDFPIVVCPNCGKKYKNPKYVAPAQAPQAPATAPAPAPVPAPAAPAPAPAPAPARVSKFTGSVGSWLGNRIVNGLLLLITIGIAYPWVLCRKYRWKTNHQIVDGYKLTFDGKGGSLIGHWILWIFLSIITIGIYSLWVPVKVQSWIAEHTHIAAVVAQ